MAMICRKSVDKKLHSVMAEVCAVTVVRHAEQYGAGALLRV